MDAETKSTIEQMGKAWHDFREVHAKMETEKKKHGEALGLTKEALDRLNGRLDALEVKQNRPAPAGAPAPSEEKQAFFSSLKRVLFNPIHALSASEQKALSVGDNTQAGYLAPTEVVAEIIKGIVEFSPVRSLARVRPTAMKEIEVPKRTGTPTAYWVGEGGTRTASNSTYGKEKIVAHALTAKTVVTKEMLADSMFDLEAEIRSDAIEQIGVAEGTAFVSGTGTAKPEGLLTNGSISFVASGSASAIAADGIIAAVFGLKDGYARNATWMLRRATLKTIRQLKFTIGSDTVGYLWSPSLSESVPATIMGLPYVESVDMPLEGSGTYPMILGDFRRGYLIVDRMAIEVSNDPYTSMGSGQVNIYVEKRVGGQVVLPEAFIKVKCST